MKAISLWQPWASLIALGEKRIETRGRRTTYRGELAIHATKIFPAEAKALMREEPFRSRLAWHGITADNETQRIMPRGAIVAVATLIEVVATTTVAASWLSRRPVTVGGYRWDVTDQEIGFGNYEQGRYAYLLAGVTRLREPVPCAGSQVAPWIVPPAVEVRVRAQLEES